MALDHVTIRSGCLTSLRPARAPTPALMPKGRPPKYKSDAERKRAILEQKKKYYEKYDSLFFLTVKLPHAYIRNKKEEREKSSIRYYRKRATSQPLDVGRIGNRCSTWDGINCRKAQRTLERCVLLDFVDGYFWYRYLSAVGVSSSNWKKIFVIFLIVFLWEALRLVSVSGLAKAIVTDATTCCLYLRLPATFGQLSWITPRSCTATLLQSPNPTVLVVSGPPY